MSGRDLLREMEKDYRREWVDDAVEKMKAMGIDEKAQRLLKEAAERNAIDLKPSFPRSRKTTE